MKNFLIFLSIIVVTLLAVSDLSQRMAELDSISKQLQVKTASQKNIQKDKDSSVKDSDSDFIKTLKYN